MLTIVTPIFFVDTYVTELALFLIQEGEHIQNTHLHY